jgi:hypothetical protein
MAIGFAKDIRPLFTDQDVDHMTWMFDLSKYDDVKSNAADILDSVKGGRMPPGEPWSSDKVQKFQDWINDGCQP